MPYTVRVIHWNYQKNKAEIYPLKIAVTVNRKVTYLLTEHRVHEGQWDGEKVINHPNAALINISLRRKIADIERDMISHTLEGVPLTKRVIRGKVSVDKPFAKYAREVRGVDKEISRVTAFAGENIMLSEMNVSFLRKFEQHERNRGMANNTMNTTFKYLRRILSQAKREKLIKENPFEEFEMVKYRQTDRTFLTQEELATVLEKADDFHGSMRVTVWYFLLGAFSGLRHSDWGRFDYETMVEDGFLKLRAKKNKKFVVMPIGVTLNKILNVVKDLPPPVSNQKCNVMLKAIGATIGLKKELTTHVARHSFGCMCAANRIPKSVTAELMGIHTQTVEVYYHLTGADIIEQAAILKTI